MLNTLKVADPNKGGVAGQTTLIVKVTLWVWNYLVKYTHAILENF